jgi:cystathionine gamma-synthase/methionine-gamma-lyase
MADKLDKIDIATQLVHAGERRPVPNGLPVATPVYTTATFTYPTMAETDQVFAGETPGFIYTRYGNPTTASLEEAMTLLEGGAGACAYATGMAALHAAIFSCELSPGATILASQDLYGATTELLLTVFGAFQVRTVTADFSDLRGVAEKARELKPRLILAETISNPLLKICDLDACAEIARSVGARLIIDNTFASPYLCRPLDHGADMVMHSATKYLSGHADTMGGVIVTREAADMTALIGTMKLVGGVLGVWNAHEIMRGMKTLGVRLERQCENAARLAEHLANHPKVARVYYPGLAGGSEREIAARMLRSPYFGALVSIELKENTRDGAFRFMDALRLCVRATSLGDVFTEVLHPPTASHREVAPVRRQKLGISDGLIRISVGIEAIADIINDIDAALAVTK